MATESQTIRVRYKAGTYVATAPNGVVATSDYGPYATARALADSLWGGGEHDAENVKLDDDRLGSTMHITREENEYGR